jgi:hypothetical protein
MLVQLHFKEVTPACLPAEQVEGLQQTANNTSSHSTDSQQAPRVCLRDTQAAETSLLAAVGSDAESGWLAALQQ